MSAFDFNCLNWSKMNGLIPAIIQDAKSGSVLMLGYMNQESLAITIKTKKITFFSRSKNSLWTKGESSGNYFYLIELVMDCDNDALLILVNPKGPACHTGSQCCFDQLKTSSWQILSMLESIIAERAKNFSPDSYTAMLLKKGISAISQKVGEEAIETVIAALNENDSRLCSEVADLLYHLLVLLNYRDISFEDVLNVLKKRKRDAKCPI